ncbi:hypothetical protein ARMGADRAFT_1056982 [Armillaria gallica]|uniref:DUF6534 domain-containing protein n=1 Tax=Armillaria gallica TaxID=47427 RepID=A0A2H3ELE4_ARMGA|nr:hypothetical protein ARMGADRAFT_1056982 [Armillaria gallica]
MSTVPTGKPTELPAFDNTLGVLYIGSSLATACGLDTAQQGLTLAGMYRFLITDYANPAALEVGGSTSGRATRELLGSAAFFWYSCKETFYRVLLLAYMDFQCLFTASPRPNRNYRNRSGSFGRVALAFLNFGQWDKTAVMLLGLRAPPSNVQHHLLHRFLTVNTPEFTLSWKLSASSGIAFDVITTMAMTLSLYRSRSGMKRSNHVITILILFTVNTNLVTTFLSIGSLVTYLVLPNATIYGGITFLLSKSYLNSFLAILNTREYLREKMDHLSQPGQSSVPDFAGPSTNTDVVSTAGEQFELSLIAAVGSSTSKV